MTRRLYLDLDGVLADFSARFRQLFGVSPEDFESECTEKFGRDGEAAFWKEIQRADGAFYENLSCTPDALYLYNAVRELKPVILTGVPFDSFPSAMRQKEAWVRRRFGPDQVVVCCDSSRKWQHCRPGDILIDDRPKHADAWRKAGGIWITHTSAAQSLEDLSRVLSEAGIKRPW
jgi:PAS domain-containing protein